MKITGATAATIAGSLEHAILEGQLLAGVSLPPVRRLAVKLRVAPATVAGAYRLLRERGLTVGDGRRGTRVREHIAATGAGVPPPSTPPSARATASSTSASRSAVDLASGNPDPERLPSLDAALRALPREPALYGASPALPALASFAAGEFAADGIPAGSLVVTSGSLDAIERILRERLRPGDRVALEDPNLPALIQLVAASGFEIVPVAVDGSGPMPASLADALAQRPAACVLSPRGQNPTGAALTAQRAAELKRVFRAAPDLLLVENDAAGPVAGVPAITLCDRTRPRWAVVRSMSKALGPDLRVAVVAGDATTVARVRLRQALGPRWVSHLLQQLVLMMWTDPAAGRQLARTAEVYSARRLALTDALRAKGIETHARSGFNVWIPVREEAVTCRELAESGWKVAAGEPFRLRSGPGIRVTTSALAPVDASRLAADLAAILQRPPVSSA